ncbi:hypothetical protein TNCV_2926641 [Trichonephila clavipes]|nr:hypothetical protein TNCV_2926641 [Trichonephila clavipes]
MCQEDVEPHLETIPAATRRSRLRVNIHMLSTKLPPTETKVDQINGDQPHTRYAHNYRPKKQLKMLQSLSARESLCSHDLV